MHFRSLADVNEQVDPRLLKLFFVHFHARVEENFIGFYACAQAHDENQL